MPTQAGRSTFPATSALWGLALPKFDVKLPVYSIDAYLCGLLKESPMVLPVFKGLNCYETTKLIRIWINCMVLRQRNLKVAMMFGFQKIIEKRIKEAQERGDFDDLPGRGEPLKIEDDSHVPEDLRLAYKVLKNANCLPPELELKKEIRQIEDMLEHIPDEKEKYRQIKRLNYKIMQLNMLGKKPPLLEKKQIYYKKLVDKLGRK